MADPASGALAADDCERQGWRDLFSLRHVAATSTVSLGVALYAFNEFFVSTALPSAIDELGGAALISWAFTFFLVFAIVGGLAAADLKARLGARTALVASALVFLAGSAVTVVADTMPVLILGRALQGLGEGVVAAICYALIPALFPPGLVQKVFGMEAVVWAVAAFAGPAFAGFLTEYFSWRMSFAVNIATGLAFIGLVFVAVPRGGGGKTSSGVPVLRLALAGGAILLVSIAGAAGTLASAASLVVAALMLFSAFLIDGRRDDPVLPAGAFRMAGTVGSGLWVIALMPFAQAASAVFVVYGLQFLFGLGATMAGAAAASLAVAWSFVAILVAFIPGEAGRLRVIAAGPFVLAAGLALSVAGVAAHSLGAIIAGQVAMGTGFGLNWGPLCQLLMDRSSDADRDRTSALLPTLQTVGYALGAAVFGLVANLAGFGDVDDLAGIATGLVTAFSGAALFAVVASVLAVYTVRKAASVSDTN